MPLEATSGLQEGVAIFGQYLESILGPFVNTLLLE
jgi:hypothetical protein